MSLLSSYRSDGLFYAIHIETTQPNLMSPYVDIENFDVANLIFLPTETREVKTPEGKIKVSKIILQYNYGTHEDPQVDKLNIRFLEITTNFGLSQQEVEREVDDAESNGKKKVKVIRSSIGGPINRNTPGGKITYDKLYEFYCACVRYVANQKVSPMIKQSHIKGEIDVDSIMSLFTPPWYIKTDSMKNRVPGAMESLYSTCYQNTSVFFAPNGKTKMDWKSLRDCTFSYRPIVTYGAISCTPKYNTIKSHLREALITSEVSALRAESEQKDIKSDDKLNQRFLDSLSRIEMQRKAALMSGTSDKTPAPTTPKGDDQESEEKDDTNIAAKLKQYVGNMETLE